MWPPAHRQPGAGPLGPGFLREEQALIDERGAGDPGVRDFVITGTGQVARVGNRVVARRLVMNGDAGPGLLSAILGPDYVMVRYDTGREEVTAAVRLRREDDDEEAGGSPLWCYG